MPPSPPETDSTAAPGLGVLLVEDHSDTARVIEMFLLGEGHSVTIAGSVSEAVASVVAGPFDLIISDVGLPDGNGVSLIHGLRAFCDTPAIALTGYDGEEHARRCLQAGFTCHLAKPFRMDELRAAIRDVAGSGPAA